MNSFSYYENKYAFSMNHGVYYGTIVPFEKIERVLGSIQCCYYVHQKLFFCGTKENVTYTANCIYIYNIDSQTILGKIEFEQPVVSLLVDGDSIIVSLQTHSYVYQQSSLELITIVPGNRASTIAFENIVCSWRNELVGNLHVFLQSSKKCIPAHQSSIRAVAINSVGNMIATASSKGTVVKVFDLPSGNTLHVLRRGFTNTEICNLTFSSCGRWLYTTGRTVHVFDLSKTTLIFPHYSVYDLNLEKMAVGSFFTENGQFCIVYAEGLIDQYTILIEPFRLIPSGSYNIWFMDHGENAPLRGTFVSQVNNAPNAANSVQTSPPLRPATSSNEEKNEKRGTSTKPIRVPTTL